MKIREIIRQYFVQTGAAIAVAYALAIPVVVTSVGIAIDYSNAYLAKERMSHALDSATLAAASSSHLSENEMRTRMQDFLKANYGHDQSKLPGEISMSFHGDEIKVSATRDVPTYFMRLIGVNNLTISEETVVRREVRGLEVALVLDVTGSMQSNNNIGALREASSNFVKTIFSRVNDPEHLRIGLVPYAATVNIGDIAPHYVSLPVVPDEKSVEYDTGRDDQWHGCVMARPYPHDTKDSTTLDGGYWDAFWWKSTADSDDNPWKDEGFNTAYNQCNNRRTPNLGCPMTNPIVPLTSNQQDLLDSIEQIVYWCRGGTLGNIGMTWGWRTLSNQEPFTQGAEYDDNLWRKAVIMMTDGQNQLWKKPGIDFDSDFSAYGRIDEGVLGTTSRWTGEDIVNERFAETCKMMKEKGITIYTITFSSGISENTKDYYRECATDATKYYDAPSQQELIDTYNKIAKQLSNLYIKG